MVGLNEIQDSLKSNPYLTDGIKENFMDLIKLFNSKFPNVNLTGLSERLKTVKVLRGSKFLIRKSSSYNPITNEIHFCLKKLDNIDCTHILMREILNMITAKNNFTGFNKDNAYEALNIGYTEILTNYLVGNECNNEYEDEVVTTNMIGQIIGNDALFNAYFNNDINFIMNEVC